MALFRPLPAHSLSGRILLALIALLLALGLAACGKKDTAAPVTAGTPLNKVAPPTGKAWIDVVSATPMRRSN